ncbi:MAG: 2Fe-2S iron-sulfur cluster binding domain-containing protein [Spirochaetales bacterium]|nr:2Fe-2S iron-sulfur cluster binding domain-containing protein [Spirochaetales bacterium]
MAYTIHFEQDGQFEVEDPGATFLETALAHKIPHEHACGGMGRCSTCRVLILEGLDQICERNATESALAKKKGLEVNVRLACQTTARGPVRLRRLVLDALDLKDASESSGASTGREANIAVLFSDIRNFTNFSEKHLPYDVIHSLNRYFARMGQCVLDHGGRIDKYMGDGLMALFGLEESDGRSICLGAVRAALDMRDSLTGINDYLKNHLNETFHTGIGIHYGNALVGVIGHPQLRQFTAIGDTVNMASRIESITKKAKSDLLISEEVYRLIADDVVIGRKFVTALKGKSGKYRLMEVKALAREVTPGPDTVQTSDDVPEAAQAVFTEPAPAEPAAVEVERAFKSAVVLDSLEMSPNTLTFRIRPADAFTFDASQAVELKLPSGESRILSIASAPSGPLLFATRIRTSAFKKELLELKSGSTVAISAPMGGFNTQNARTLLMLAGGIGVTPFRSLIEEMVARPEKRKPITLLYSVRLLGDAVFLDLMESWVLELPDFRFELFGSEMLHPQPPYRMGRITAADLQEHLREDSSILIAGSPRFVKGMQALVKELNLPGIPVLTERFAGY